MRAPEISPEEQIALVRLEKRIGRLHVRQRLGLERDYEAHVFRQGTHFFHLENWYSIHSLIRNGLRLVGLHGRGRRNTMRFELCEQEIPLNSLPPAFDGYTILHLSDLHVDMNEMFVPALIKRLQGLSYDLCVLTGDFRARTFGPFRDALAGMEKLRGVLRGEPVAILGNHDTLRMVPGLEEMGYRVLLNENMKLSRASECIYVAGIDDAHFYRMENFHRAAGDVPSEACSILLSHTPETWRHAAHAGFDLMLCGHTHGGQICLPGGTPILTDADSPRSIARGAWRYHNMQGYTSAGTGSSIVDVRLNCPPEITLHRLRCTSL